MKTWVIEVVLVVIISAILGIMSYSLLYNYATGRTIFRR